MKSADERWGKEALAVAQAVRERMPAATRNVVMAEIRAKIPSAPRGRRSLETAIAGWLEAGELPPFVRSKS